MMRAWRAHATNLLSREFLEIARRHLKPGGILYYNTTHSPDAQFTGAATFPYVYRFGPFLAVSDSAISFSRERWRQTLMEYRIEGEPILDLSDADDHARLEEIVASADEMDAAEYDRWGMETAAAIRRRTRGRRIITDDNMASEWTR